MRENVKDGTAALQDKGFLTPEREQLLKIAAHRPITRPRAPRPRLDVIPCGADR
jgi:hypothetical protein